MAQSVRATMLMRAHLVGAILLPGLLLAQRATAEGFFWFLGFAGYASVIYFMWRAEVDLERWGYLILGADLLLATALVYSRGAASDIYLVYLLVILSAATFAGLRATLVTAVLSVAFYLAVLHFTVGLVGTGAKLVVRASFMALSGFIAAQVSDLVRRENSGARGVWNPAQPDPVTGLHTQGYARQRLAEALQACRDSDGYLGLILVDADHFRAVNERAGHLAGDHVLRQLAGRLREQLREGDMVARYGGEEFLVLLPGANETLAARVAERLRLAVAAEPFQIPGAGNVALTVSAGVAVTIGGAVGAEDLIILAERALYAAKARGRNRVEAERMLAMPQLAGN